MSSEIIAAIIGALIGGALSAGTGWVLDRSREKARISKLRELLIIAICDDLQHSINLYEKIAEDWEKTNTVWFPTLNEIKESRYTYQNNKDWIHVFDNAELRRGIFRYYLQSADCINTLENQQRRKYELRSKFNDTVRKIRFDDSKMTKEDASNLAIQYMDEEDQEFRSFEKSIPESISKLFHFKSKAEGLLRDLKKSP
ncbi:MAG: hypothetical protein ACSLFL_16315 [Alphaproteobacteria bacterium]